MGKKKGKSKKTLGKKGRMKKNNQENQGNDQDDSPRHPSRDLDVADFIKHQEKELDPHSVTSNDEEKEGHDQDDTSRCHQDKELEPPNDIISGLPKDVLHKIISLLTFKSAVRTTFLSTQWKELWKEVLLDTVGGHTDKDAVSAILTFLDNFGELYRPRKKWGFNFEFSNGKTLLVAISPSSTLVLDFSDFRQEFPTPFNWSLGSPRGNKSFQFWSDRYSEDDQQLHTKQPSFNVIKARSLHLISVTKACIELVSSVVSNRLPFLDSLTIVKCNELQSLQIKDARCLRKLVVLDCPQLKFLCFEGDCLTSFQYRGRLLDLQFKRSCSRYRWWGWGIDFQDTMLDFRLGPPICYSIDDCSFNSILNRIRYVKSLTLCRWTFQELVFKMLPSLSHGCYKFEFSGLNELWWIDCSMETDNVNALLAFLKLCPNLERLYVTVDPKSYKMTSTKFLVEVEALHHLDLLVLEGFADEKKEVLFAHRLRHLLRKRPLVLAKSKGAYLRYLVTLPELEQEGKYAYKFIEHKNFQETCHVHPHMKL